MLPRPQVINPPLPTWIIRTVDTVVTPHRSRYTTKHSCVYAHVALIFQGKKIIAIGQNRVGRRGPFNMVHAERDAIRRVPPAALRGAVLVVIRLGPRGLLNSKPCAACEQLLQKCQRTYGLRDYLFS
jgi:hypothetical protein